MDKAKLLELAEWVSRLWCDWTHGGGSIERDEQGRINWRCRKCGRWSPHPVSLKDELRALAAKEPLT